MADTYLIHKNQAALDSAAPTTHAIIIGVGHYAHLPGGEGEPTSKDGGLSQLSSPPASARKFCDWLLDEFNHPDKDLATISLLLSEPGGNVSYDHPNLHKLDDIPGSAVPPVASITNVKKAIREWKQFGDRNEKNLMLFFFCGHGVSQGLEGITLLLSDYGEAEDFPMEGAIDFLNFYQGMQQCKASYQCYFVDACRVVSDIATRTTETGNAIIQNDRNRPFDSEFNLAVFYSTIGGEKAYGRKNKPSYFTEELIKGLDGKGSHNRIADGRWRVETHELNAAIHHGLSLRGDKIKNPIAYMSQYEIHFPKSEPIIPVTVFCDPKQDNENAYLSVSGGDSFSDERAPCADDWELNLPHGRYDFVAKVDTRRGDREGEYVFPPYREISIKVKL